MSDYPGAIGYFVDRGRTFVNANTRKAIVIHKTASNASSQSVEQLGNYFRTNTLVVSSHYGIGLDGRTAQYVLESDGAAANCCLEPGYDPFWDQFGGVNLNTVTLSVEHIDLTKNNSQIMPEVQIQASFNLIEYWVKKYAISIYSIKGHNTIDPINRADCPGSTYPWDRLMALLEGKGMGVPKGWTDNGTTLKNPINSYVVVRGFREHILADPNWASDNVPLQNEQAYTRIEYSNPGEPGTAQTFRTKRLIWTPAKGVKDSWIGQEYAYWYENANGRL